MIKYIIGVLSCFIMLACGAGVSDIVKDLPNNYTYVSEAPMQKWIAQKPLSINSDLYIPCRILKYKYNKHYIIAKIRFHYDQNCIVGFSESKILREGQIYYYILDTKKNIRYGAFEDEKEFNKKINELQINLKL